MRAQEMLFAEEITQVVPFKDTFADKKKKRLQALIKKRKEQLGVITSNFTLLQMELESIKREYYLRVGNLFSRDNQLDIEIIKQKNILSYIRAGMSHEEATRALEQSYFGDEQFDEQDFDFAEHVSLEQEENPSTYSQLALKKLWKKAVMKFHPDLVSNKEEKKRREHIMKKLNQAYAEGDYEVLEQLYHSEKVFEDSETTIEELEQALLHVENMIIKTKNDTLALKGTEWYGWKTKIRKAKKTGKDVFKELERALLDDIVKKMGILKELQREVGKRK
jgi:hypothetical protein